MPPLTTGSLPVGAVNALTPSDPLNPHDMTEHDERHSQTFVQVPVREELLLEAPGCFHPAALPISSTVPVTTLPSTIAITVTVSFNPFDNAMKWMHSYHPLYR